MARKVQKKHTVQIQRVITHKKKLKEEAKVKAKEKTAKTKKKNAASAAVATLPRKRKPQRDLHEGEVPDDVPDEVSRTEGFLGLAEISAEDGADYNKLINAIKSGNTLDKKKFASSPAESFKMEPIPKRRRCSQSSENPPAIPTSKVKATVETKDENTEDGDTEAPENEPDTNVDTTSLSEWAPFCLHPKVLKGIQKLGFTHPTPIQQKCIPVAVNFFKDVIGAAETGSGKTLAFGIPIMHHLMCHMETASGKEEIGNYILGLMLSPTRELAMQIVHHLNPLAAVSGVRVISVVGGMSSQRQLRLLSENPELVVATPGRLWDLMAAPGSPLRDLSHLRWFVIDEADRMVEEGHFRELDRILDCLLNSTGKSGTLKPILRQTFIFSATLTYVPKFTRRKRKPTTLDDGTVAVPPPETSNALKALLDKVDFQRKFEVIDVTTEKLTVSQLQEFQQSCMPAEKDVLLFSFIKKHPGRTLIFVNTISMVRRLVPLLNLLNIDAHGLHSSMQQRQRIKNLERFSKASNSVLVATDIAARGIDVQNVSHVIHFQAPKTLPVYVHRVGRTARAGEKGTSILFLCPNESLFFSKIITQLKREIPALPKENAVITADMNAALKTATDLDKLLHQQKKEHREEAWTKQVKKNLHGDPEEEADDAEDEDKDGDEEDKDAESHSESDLENDDSDEDDKKFPEEEDTGYDSDKERQRHARRKEVDSKIRSTKRKLGIILAKLDRSLVLDARGVPRPELTAPDAKPAPAPTALPSDTPIVESKKDKRLRAKGIDPTEKRKKPQKSGDLRATAASSSASGIPGDSAFSGKVVIGKKMVTVQLLGEDQVKATLENIRAIAKREKKHKLDVSAPGMDKAGPTRQKLENAFARKRSKKSQRKRR
ncbi:ATP-dependent RNA helicase [Pelomyxa schiedti]|nr:ATP-dependent RNA helicase [Pelomyxa schiedti]